MLMIAFTLFPTDPMMITAFKVAQPPCFYSYNIEHACVFSIPMRKITYVGNLDFMAIRFLHIAIIMMIIVLLEKKKKKKQTRITQIRTYNARSIIICVSFR